MSAKILIPTPLRAFTGQQAVVEVDGAATVAELLERLTTKHPEVRNHLYAADGKLRSFVNIYVNDEDIRYTGREATPVKASDTVSIVPSVAGGSGAAVAGTAGTNLDDLPQLSNDEVARYSRHLILPEVGMDGQRKLKAAKVLCVGAGGLGAPASLYLAAAGIGTIGLVDFDNVDASNLQRQVLFSTSDVGKPKVLAAAARLKGLNPNLNVRTHEMALTSKNALEIFKDYDVIVDGADNFPTRYLVNDACVLTGKPNAYGSIFRFDGQASVFATKGGPCYRCLYPEPPPPGLVPSCAEGGVLGVLPGVVGTIQATEAIKVILGAGDPLIGRLLLFDALHMTFRTLKLRRDPECPVCGDHPTVTTLIDYEQFCGVPSIAEGATHAPESVREFEATVEELKDKIDRKVPLFILDVREPNEYQISRIPGAVLIPLGQLPNRLSEVPKGPGAPEIIVHCKMGGRSAKAVAMMRDQGFTRIKNLVGGVLAWSDRIDPSQPKY